MTRLRINYSVQSRDRETIEIDVPNFDEDRSWTSGENCRNIRRAVQEYRSAHSQERIADYDIGWSAHNIEILPDIFDPAHGLADEHVDVVTIGYSHKGGEYKEMDVRVPSPFGNPETDGLGWGFKRTNVARDAIRAQSGLAQNEVVEIQRLVRVVSTGTPAPIELIPSDTPDGFVSKDALANVMRELAIENNWCSAHHTPLRQLGVEPKTVKFQTYLTVQIPVIYEKTDYFGSVPHKPEFSARPTTAQAQALIDALKATMRYSGIYDEARLEIWTYGDVDAIKISVASDDPQKVLS